MLPWRLWPLINEAATHLDSTTRAYAQFTSHSGRTFPSPISSHVLRLISFINFIRASSRIISSNGAQNSLARKKLTHVLKQCLHILGFGTSQKESRLSHSGLGLSIRRWKRCSLVFWQERYHQECLPWSAPYSTSFISPNSNHTLPEPLTPSKPAFMPINQYLSSLE